METSLTSFKERFHELLLSFLWRQWSALGVAGHAVTGDPWMIDPEALLLFSTVAARRDARLFDEIFDWLHVNGSWINLQRLAHLQKQREIGDASILTAIADHLAAESAHLKWRTVARRTPRPPATRAAKPLFPGVPVLGETDDKFLRMGWQRGPVKFRGLSQGPRPDQPATFLLKLRAIFGRQSRAEVIAWLLAHESGHPAEMARQIGYFPRSVQLVLNELALSGHVHAVRSAREKHFAVRHEEWRFLITWKTEKPDDFPRWVPWRPIFRVLRGLYDLLDRPELETMSVYLQAIEIKRVFGAIAQLEAGLPSHFIHTQDRSGAEYIEAALSELKELLG